MTILKLLVANRGEIACRIIETARKLGLKTAVVYSEADAGSRAVRWADEAFFIGGPEASDSYLNIPKIIAAAQAFGADAVHPGYGFLSENPDFVEACETAGLTFVGPSASAIRAMGLKDAAKALMTEAGVPVVPGYHGSEQDPDFLAAKAAEIGYPVLIKARAGGGGKGMRRVDDAGDFIAALEGAQREGLASFGDRRVLIEKFLVKPRHIEIQVLADAHGQTVHLFERDCSLQRRHQKVIEEAPAPGMKEAMRTKMGKAAVKAAHAVGYCGAGTVEFIADVSDGLRDDRFYFMEMNTRLQVEHPVTELITGLDLVELQLRVAAGERLPFDQEDLSISGHAVEARLYAEDAENGFLPQTGQLRHLVFPDGKPGVRVDAGVEAGDQITRYYDPMIAKLITHGPDRATALRTMKDLLTETQLIGTVTNIRFLAALIDHPAFQAGDMDTGLIDRELDGLTAYSGPDPDMLALVALGLSGLLNPPKVDADPWSHKSGFRIWGRATKHVQISVNGAISEAIITLPAHQDDTLSIAIDDVSFAVVLYQRAVTLTAEFASVVAFQAECHQADELPQMSAGRFARSGDDVQLVFRGRTLHASLVDPFARIVGSASEASALAPLPGLVSRVFVAEGDMVDEGTAIMVLEAMKMEHTLKAGTSGQLARLLVSQGDQIEAGTALFEIVAPQDADDAAVA